MGHNKMDPNSRLTVFRVDNEGSRGSFYTSIRMHVYVAVYVHMYMCEILKVQLHSYISGRYVSISILVCTQIHTYIYIIIYIYIYVHI